MPNRINHIVERTVVPEPPKVFTLVAKTSTVVLLDTNPQTQPNTFTDQGWEVAGRWIFNDSGGKLYYAIGNDKCDNVGNYHGAIADQGLLDLTFMGGCIVSVWSTAGGNCSVIVLHRKDLFGHRGEIPAARP